MLSMLLVVGSLVPASDSPEVTTDAPQPSVANTSLERWGLIRRGMIMDEVTLILGTHTLTTTFVRPVRIGKKEVLELLIQWDYWKTGVSVSFFKGKVTQVTSGEPRFRRGW